MEDQEAVVNAIVETHFENCSNGLESTPMVSLENVESTPMVMLDNLESTPMVTSEDPTPALVLFPNKTLLELSNATWRNITYSDKSQPYIRGCAWSPDGTCCLSVVNADGVHVSELPRDLYADGATSRRDVDVLTSVIHVRESGLVYDFCWYPGMNSSLPETCCWLTTRQNGPLQLWDAFDGALRCTYRGFNAVDEMEPALSCTFSTDGAEIYAGYKKCIRTFYTSRPGRDCSAQPLKAPASCLAASGKLLAVGSWNTSLGLYAVNETGTFKSVGKMHGHSGGITHAKFTRDGQKLVTGARKDHHLLVWDLRFYRRPLNILSRRVDTNQRVYFDISPCGRYLVSGSTDGVLRVWDSVSSDWSSANAGTCEDEATFQFQLHNDCCSSVSIHPYRPIIATGSGQFHSRDPIALLRDSTDDVGQSEAESDDIDQSDVKVNGEVKCENSLVFWWIGSVPKL